MNVRALLKERKLCRLQGEAIALLLLVEYLKSGKAITMDVLERLLEVNARQTLEAKTTV